MGIKESFRKIGVLTISAVMALTLLQGCGTEENAGEEHPMDSMVRFSSSDESISLMLDEEWISKNDETENESWIKVQDKSEDEGVMVMQFPKYSTGQNVSCLEDAKTIIEDVGYYYGNEVGAPNIPCMTNVTSSIGTIEVDDGEVGAYIVYGETEYANYVFLFVTSEMTEDFMQKMLVSCGTFQEDISLIDHSSVEMTDTLQWINTVNAIIIEEHNWNHDYFGGLPLNEDTKDLGAELLENNWETTDQAKVEETWNWLIDEGRRQDFATDMQTLADWGLGQIEADDRSYSLWTDADMDFEEAEFWAEMYTLYEEKGASAINGWDYGNAMEFLQACYIAGYYTEQEALDKAMEIGKLIQGEFGSWDEFMESYLDGYEYWYVEEPIDYQVIYQQLKGQEDSPYDIDFSTNLEKTW